MKKTGYDALFTIIQLHNTEMDEERAGEEGRKRESRREKKKRERGGEGRRRGVRTKAGRRREGWSRPFLDLHGETSQLEEQFPQVTITE